MLVILSGLKMKAVKIFSVLLTGMLFATMSFSAKAVDVMVSIAPLAGMVAPLLGPDDQLKVTLDPGKSPHGFQMKPSDLKALHRADLLVWVGTPVDWWMEKPIHRLRATAISMNSLEGLIVLPVRKGGLWQNEGAEGEGHHGHHHGHDDHEHHDQGGDGHLWMHPDNAMLLVKAVSKELQRLKPHDVKQIKKREMAWLQKLQSTTAEIKEKLAPIKNQPYLVLHDAYNYYDNYFQLKGVGALHINPTVSMSLKRVSVLREKVRAGAVKCVFKEPQFPAKNILAVTRGMDVGIGSLDPIGSSDKNLGYMPYDQFIQELADQLHRCLSK